MAAHVLDPFVPAEEGASWESEFNEGLDRSRRFVEDTAPSAWEAGSDGAAPMEMLRAELLLQAAEGAPPELSRSKVAERALRVYHHAKWLAERNHERAAEYRYRLAADLARKARRSVLAAHALSRLGYFLVQWKRSEEALPVLEEAEQFTPTSNPLAQYLRGVLQRSSGADAATIRAAEDRLLTAAKLPSEELEAERRVLSQEIAFWRQAEKSPRQCVSSTDVAHILICLCGHIAFAFNQAIDGGM